MVVGLEKQKNRLGIVAAVMVRGDERKVIGGGGLVGIDGGVDKGVARKYSGGGNGFDAGVL